MEKRKNETEIENERDRTRKIEKSGCVSEQNIAYFGITEMEKDNISKYREKDLE